MRNDDFPKFKSIMAGMAAIFQRDLSTELMDGYWLALRNWSIDDFESASARLLETSQFMPRPADFHSVKKAGRPTYAESWVQAVEHCRSSAYRRGPMVDEITDRAVAALGGYVAIAMCDEDKLHYLERRFQEIYEGMQDAGDIRAALPNLTPIRAIGRDK